MSVKSIKLEIGNRVYPMHVKPEQETLFLKAAQFINQRIKEYEQRYAVRDMQDLLAMAALELANQKFKNGDEPNFDLEAEHEHLGQQITELERFISNFLDKRNI
jgi:cell division protein ZapA